MLVETVFELLHSELVTYTTENKVRFRFWNVVHATHSLNSQNSIHIQENDLSTLEYLGYSTGYRLIERLTREYPRFKDELDTMKFICTDFWTSIYKKQIDNLRTNHQGIYVLQDNSFRFLTNLSNGSQYLECAPKVSVVVEYQFALYTRIDHLKYELEQTEIQFTEWGTGLDVLMY